MRWLRWTIPYWKSLIFVIECIIRQIILGWSVECASHVMNCLSSIAVGDKTLLDIWSGETAQDYDLLPICWYPAYFSVKDDKLNPRAKNFMFFGVKRNLKDTNYGTPKIRISYWVGLSHLMRLHYWSLPSLSRWRGWKLMMYRSGWRLILLHHLQLVWY